MLVLHPLGSVTKLPLRGGSNFELSLGFIPPGRPACGDYVELARGVLVVLVEPACRSAQPASGVLDFG